MSAHPRKTQKEITTYLARYGITVLGVEWTGNCHRRMRVTDGAKTATVLISGSPSDHRVYRNICKTARSALREAP